jgi:hypothetical protein
LVDHLEAADAAVVGSSELLRQRVGMRLV